MVPRLLRHYWDISSPVPTPAATYSGPNIRVGHWELLVYTVTVCSPGILAGSPPPPGFPGSVRY